MKITFKSWSFYILKIKWFCHFDSDFFWSYRNSYSHTISQVVPKNVLCFIYKLQKNFVFLLLSPVYYIAYYNGAHLYSMKYFSWILTIYKVWYSTIHILCHGFMFLHFYLDIFAFSHFFWSWTQVECSTFLCFLPFFFPSITHVLSVYFFVKDAYLQKLIIFWNVLIW